MQERVYSDSQSASLKVEQSRPAWLLYAATIACIALVICLNAWPPQIRFSLESTGMAHAGGHAYRAVVPELKGWSAFLRLRADRDAAPSLSSLVLRENGKAVGPAHALPDEVRERGLGRYAHRGEYLYFSTPDNSDPRSNGRSYSAQASLETPLYLLALSGVLAIFAAGAAFEAPLARRIAWPIVRYFLSPGDAPLRWPALTLASAAIVLVGVAAMLLLWRSGVTNASAFAAFLPISDAKGHYECAQSLIDFGTNDSWCHRRPIYSVFLAGLSFLTGRDLGALHIAQCVITLAACAIYAREIARWLGLGPAILSFFGLVYFSWHVVFAQTMTEVFGLSVGLVGQAVLLRAAGMKAVLPAAFGVFLVSAALSARPGGVVVLGLLVLFVAWLGMLSSPRRALFALAAGAGAAILGFALHSFCMIVVHGDLGGSFGNFSLTVYGLSVGGGWDAALADHPNLISENAAAYNKLYGLAFQNIVARPDVFVHGMWSNFLTYTHFQWDGWMSSRVFRPLLWLIALAATAACAIRSQRALLVLVFMVGEAASSLIIARDSEMRGWVATLASAQLAPLILVLTLFGRGGARFLGVPALAVAAPPPSRPFERIPLVFAGAVAAIMMLHALGITRLSAVRTVRNPPACPAGLSAAVITLEKGAGVLVLDDEAAAPQVWPRRLSRSDFLAGMPASAWFSAPTKQLGEVRVIQANNAIDGGQRIVALYAPAAMRIPSDAPVALCVDPRATIEVAGAPYQRIVSARRLKDSR